MTTCGTDEVAGLRLVDYGAGTQLRPLAWLWEPWFIFGSVSILEGDPGLNKSSLLLDIAARLTQGREMPCGGEAVTPRGVLILSGEDCPETTIKARLIAADAALDQVHRVPADQDVLIPRDLPELESLVRRHSIGLIVIDPIESFFECDTNNNHETRRVLTRVKGLAERTGVAVVLLRHLTKGREGRKLTQGLGAIGITGAGRVVSRVDPLKSGKSRKLSRAKGNLTEVPIPIELSCESCQVRINAVEVETIRIVWHGPIGSVANPPEQANDQTATEAAAANRTKKRNWRSRC